MIRIFLRMVDGETKMIRLKNSPTLRDLHLAVWEATGIPWTNTKNPNGQPFKCQTLIFDGVPLPKGNDEQPLLSGFGVGDGSVVHVVDDCDVADRAEYLNIAAIHGILKALAFLIENGDHSIDESLNSYPPIYNSYNFDVADYILGVGATLSNEDADYDLQPLHQSLEPNRTETAISLIAAGADLEAQTLEGMAPIEYCLEKGEDRDREKIVALLLESGASVPQKILFRPESFNLLMQCCPSLDPEGNLYPEGEIRYLPRTRDLLEQTLQMYDFDV